MTAARLGVALLAFAGFTAFGATAARPDAGRHDAQFCVATLPNAPNCGPAQVDLRADGTVRLRVDDIAYNMKLNSSQVAVVVMHNVVQIDAFTAPYAWVGNTLQFGDGDRNARYEIRFATRKLR